MTFPELFPTCFVTQSLQKFLQNIFKQIAVMLHCGGNLASKAQQNAQSVNHNFYIHCWIPLRAASHSPNSFSLFQLLSFNTFFLVYSFSTTIIVMCWGLISSFEKNLLRICFGQLLLPSTMCLEVLLVVLKWIWENVLLNH